ncbi:MAG: hypothetical protein AAF487_03095 [Bacteroidota bacterium]
MIEPDFSFRNLVYIVNKRFTFFILVAIVAGFSGWVFTSPYFLKPRFQSTATVYPKNLEPFSEESETEQMLQLFEFSEIKDTLVDKYMLYNRWGLKPGEPEYNYWLDLLWAERVSIRPTKYESVVISCQDESPDTAKLMVEEILYQFNRLTNMMERETYAEYVSMKEEEVRYLKEIMATTDQELLEVRESTGMISMSGQLERLMEGYMRMVEKGSSGARFNQISEKLDRVNRDGGKLINGAILMSNLGDVYTEVLEDLNEAQSYSTRNVSYTNVISKPKVADKKTWPVRWMLFLGIMAGSLLLALMIFAFIDKRPAE